MKKITFFTSVNFILFTLLQITASAQWWEEVPGTMISTTQILVMF